MSPSILLALLEAFIDSLSAFSFAQGFGLISLTFETRLIVRGNWLAISQVLRLWLCSRQLFDKCLFLSLWLRLRLLVGQSLLIRPFDRRNLIELSLIVSPALRRVSLFQPLASLEVIGEPISLRSLSLCSSQWVDQASFSATRFARGNWLTSLSS